MVDSVGITVEWMTKMANDGGEIQITLLKFY